MGCESEGAGGHSGGSFRSPPNTSCGRGRQGGQQSQGAGGRGGGGLEVEGIRGQKNMLGGKGIGLNYNNRVPISISYLGGNSEVSGILSILVTMDKITSSLCVKVSPRPNSRMYRCRMYRSECTAPKTFRLKLGSSHNHNTHPR
jgi:hypothetical protein